MSSMEWKPKQRGLYNSSAVKGKMFQNVCSVFHLNFQKKSDVILDDSPGHLSDDSCNFHCKMPSFIFSCFSIWFLQGHKKTPFFKFTETINTLSTIYLSNQTTDSQLETG